MGSEIIVDSESVLTAKVVDSVVVKGDISALSPADRAKYYVSFCESLGLNPAAQPLAPLRLNGKEILYPTRGATDQLASIHRVNREIIDGPKVIDLAGTKLVYAVCKASLPNGRTETAVATVPLADPANVLMKCETKAKRRATLSILGLGLLDETELETIPASAKSAAPAIDLGSTKAAPQRDTGRLPLSVTSDGLGTCETPQRIVDDYLDLSLGDDAPSVEQCAAIYVDAKKDLCPEDQAAGFEALRRACGCSVAKLKAAIAKLATPVPTPEAEHARERVPGEDDDKPAPDKVFGEVCIKATTLEEFARAWVEYSPTETDGVKRGESWAFAAQALGCLLGCSELDAKRKLNAAVKALIGPSSDPEGSGPTKGKRTSKSDRTAHADSTVTQSQTNASEAKPEASLSTEEGEKLRWWISHIATSRDVWNLRGSWRKYRPDFVQSSEPLTAKAFEAACKRYVRFTWTGSHSEAELEASARKFLAVDTSELFSTPANHTPKAPEAA